MLTLTNIRKSFGAATALDGVDLTINAGEVHAVIGENGAGKSTLMKIIAGVYQPNKGEMRLQGALYCPRSPAEARQKGIAMIHQELALCLHLTVLENMTLGQEQSKWGIAQRQEETARAALERIGHADLALDIPVNRLPIGLRQIVEIGRALWQKAEIVIMDEPTSSLTVEDREALFAVIRRLRDSGAAVIYISHFLEEGRKIADRYTVLRDGRSVAHGKISEVTLSELVAHMVGRPLTDMFPKVSHRLGEVLLTAKDLRGYSMPANASFVLRRGEILGIAGLVGSGRTETLRTLFGMDPLRSGEIRISARQIRLRYWTPNRALAYGMGMLSENRQEEGLAVKMNIAANITLSALKRQSCRGFISLNAERRAAEKWRDRLALRCRSVEQKVCELSGGNQQKVALARLLHHDADILLLDEPTRGIDVAAKAEIYGWIGHLAANGKAIIMVSSYLPEILGICDTIAVMHRGRLSPILPATEWNEQNIMLYAASGIFAPQQTKTLS